MKTRTKEEWRDFIMKENGTEPPFENEYFQHFEAGIYVDALSEKPLFASSFKFDAGCGWPSFFVPLDEDEIIYQWDYSGGRQRMEIRSKTSKSHLGHVFDDGPPPTFLRYCLNSAALKFIPEQKIKREEEFKSIVLAAGCFWGVQKKLDSLEGVERTLVGYTQGRRSFPTYEEVCRGSDDHVEAVLVFYDEKKIELAKLLDFFWSIHNPRKKDGQGVDVGRQYRSGIYFMDKEQEQMIKESKSGVEHSEKVVTEILPAKAFYFAESYHQKYLDKKMSSL